MRIRARFWGLGGVLTVGGVILLLTSFASAAPARAQHVSWDIINVSPIPLAPPLTFNPDGEASAQTPEGATITLTGSGTFVAPAGGNGGSNAVTGGGTWETVTAAVPPTVPPTTVVVSGTYEVKELVAWEFANLQAQPPLGPSVTDNTGDNLERANGTAVLRIEFSDGKSGVLTVGCHGPGAPAGIFEGIATTKGFTTYYNVFGTPPGVPPAGVDEGRTLFHVAG
jgi:hypothetical protein